MVKESSKSSILQKPIEGVEYKPRVQMNKDMFEELIQSKGLDCYLDKAYKCPCFDRESSSVQSSCKNCGGSGWVFANRIKLRSIIHSINRQTKYQEWSREMIGTVSITTRDDEALSFMDRITVLDSISFHKETLNPIVVNDGGDKVVVFTTYSIKSIDAILKFESPDSKLTVISNSDVQFSDNIISLPDTLIAEATNNTLRLSISYKHSPQFHVLDIVRETMTIEEKLGSKITKTQMPVNAIGRRSQYVLDAESYTGDTIFDNTWRT